MGNAHKYKLHEILLNDAGDKVDCVINELGTLHTYNIPSVILAMNNGIKIKNAYVKNNELFYKTYDHKFIDLIKVSPIGEWDILEYLGNRHWKCKCSCGKIKSVYGDNLRAGTSKNCGHNSNCFIDLKDKTFGTWKVLSYVGDNKWKCECTCGCKTIRIVEGSSLRSGKSKSCGKDTNQFKNIKNQQFNSWTVLEYIGNQLWLCKCSCGTIKPVDGRSLRNGLSTSCGHDTTKLSRLEGQTFGAWKVLSYAGDYKWNCECKCGNKSAVHIGNLLSYNSLSCGHCNYHREDWQKEALHNQEKFNSIIFNAVLNIRDKLTVKEVVQLFDISEVHCKRLINKYNSTFYIKHTISNEELSLVEYLHSLNIDIIQHDRTVLDGRELDIYIPDKKLAIEYNGSYWHNSLIKSYKYHQEKTLSCLEKEIHLIHIFDYEWKNPITQLKLKALLKNMLNIEQKIIYAKDTEIREVDINTYKLFLDTYHLQNSIYCETALGLYYNNELIELMTFGKPRFNGQYDIELLRLCTKTGYKIIGGVSKLFKHYIKEHPTESIISYCNLSKFTGKVYEQLNMTYDGISNPNYVYVNSRDLSTLSRQQCTKEKLLANGYGTPDMTEEQIMYMNKYFKIYDSGNARYVYKPN